MTDFVIDISHWQDVTDWSAIRNSGVRAIFHKFSQGADYRDPRYAERRFAASGSGLLFGRYHFGTGENVAAQVGNLLEGWMEDEALALDWEDILDELGHLKPPEEQMSPEQAEQFVSFVFAQTGVWPVLYSGNRLKDSMLKGFKPKALLNCRLWLAQWGTLRVLPAGWDKAFLWQHSSTGTVPGITGLVDLDRYDGTEDELRAEWTPSVAPVVIVPKPQIRLDPLDAIAKAIAPYLTVQQRSDGTAYRAAKEACDMLCSYGYYTTAIPNDIWQKLSSP